MNWVYDLPCLLFIATGRFDGLDVLAGPDCYWESVGILALLA